MSNFELLKKINKTGEETQCLLHPQIKLNGLNEKENILTFVSYMGLNTATFAYIFMFNIKLWKNSGTLTEMFLYF